MKKSLALLSTGTLCLAAFACSTAATAPTDIMSSGGSGGSGAAAGTSTGVAGGAGSSVGGGATSAGGTSSGMAGSTAIAGFTSAGGASGTSGSAGASGGSAGGTTGGSGGAPDLLGIVGSWDGALVEYACGNTGSGYDCQQPAIANCTSVIGTDTPPSVLKPSNGAATSWTIGGTTGTVYNVTVRIRGVVEVNSYHGGARDEGTTSILQNLDLFQQGGTPQVNGDPSYDYNTYEVDVTPPVDGAANTYFLNSVTDGENPHAGSSPTTHLTFPIDYTKTIKVPGGGSVKLSVTDSNCTEVQNCGPTSGNTCAAPRSVGVSGSTPAAPASFVQPFQQPSGKYGQWVFFDITSVTVAQ